MPVSRLAQTAQILLLTWKNVDKKPQINDRKKEPKQSEVQK